MVDNVAKSPHSGKAGSEAARARVQCGEKEQQARSVTRKQLEVHVRIRKLDKREVALSGNLCCVRAAGPGDLQLRCNGTTIPFHFENVLGAGASHADTYHLVGEHLVAKVAGGCSAIIAAFGSAGAGKTHTMLGNLASIAYCNHSVECGFAPRVFKGLFTALKAERGAVCTVACTFVELCGGEAFDLTAEGERVPLTVSRDAQDGLLVHGLHEHAVDGADAALHVLVSGAARRSTSAAPGRGGVSSSHTVFALNVHRRAHGAVASRTATLHLVDLASPTEGLAGWLSSKDDKPLLLEGSKALSPTVLALADLVRAGQAEDGDRCGLTSSALLMDLLADALHSGATVAVVAAVSPFVQASSETKAALELLQHAREVGNAVVGGEGGANTDAPLRSLRSQVAELQSAVRLYKVKAAERDELSRRLRGQSVSPPATVCRTLSVPPPPPSICATHLEPACKGGGNDGAVAGEHGGGNDFKVTTMEQGKRAVSTSPSPAERERGSTLPEVCKGGSPNEAEASCGSGDTTALIAEMLEWAAEEGTQPAPRGNQKCQLGAEEKVVRGVDASRLVHATSMQRKLEQSLILHDARIASLLVRLQVQSANVAGAEDVRICLAQLAAEHDASRKADRLRHDLEIAELRAAHARQLEAAATTSAALHTSPVPKRPRGGCFSRASDTLGHSSTTAVGLEDTVVALQESRTRALRAEWIAHARAIEELNRRHGSALQRAREDGDVARARAVAEERRVAEAALRGEEARHARAVQELRAQHADALRRAREDSARQHREVLWRAAEGAAVQEAKHTRELQALRRRHEREREGEREEHAVAMEELRERARVREEAAAETARAEALAGRAGEQEPSVVTVLETRVEELQAELVAAHAGAEEARCAHAVFLAAERERAAADIGTVRDGAARELASMQERAAEDVRAAQEVATALEAEKAAMERELAETRATLVELQRQLALGWAMPGPSDASAVTTGVDPDSATPRHQVAQEASCASGHISPPRMLAALSPALLKVDSALSESETELWSLPRASSGFAVAPPRLSSGCPRVSSASSCAGGGSLSFSHAARCSSRAGARSGSPMQDPLVLRRPEVEAPEAGPGQPAASPGALGKAGSSATRGVGGRRSGAAGAADGSPGQPQACEGIRSVDSNFESSSILPWPMTNQESLAAHSDLASEGSVHSSPTPSVALAGRRARKATRPCNPVPPQTRPAAATIALGTRERLELEMALASPHALRPSRSTKPQADSQSSIASAATSPRRTRSKTLQPPRVRAQPSQQQQEQRQRVLRKQQQYQAFQAQVQAKQQVGSVRSGSVPPRQVQPRERHASALNTFFRPWSGQQRAERSLARRKAFMAMEQIMENGQRM